MAIVNNPNYLRIDEKANLAANKIRRDYVLDTELKYKLITRAEHDAAIATPITPKITPTTTGCAGAGSAAFFCDYVVNVVKNDPSFGKTPGERYNKLQSAGWKIYTTLDLGLQSKASAAMKANVPAKSAPGTDLGGAAVSVEARTGRILSMVENKRFDDTAEQGDEGRRLHGDVDQLQHRRRVRRLGRVPARIDLQDVHADRLARARSRAERDRAGHHASTYPAGSFACANPDAPWTFGQRHRGRGRLPDGHARDRGLGERRLRLDGLGAQALRHPRSPRRPRGPPRERRTARAEPARHPRLEREHRRPAHDGERLRDDREQGRSTASRSRSTRSSATDGTTVTPPQADCHRALPESIAIAVGYALHGVLTGGTAAADARRDRRRLGLREDRHDGRAPHSTWVVGGTTTTSPRPGSATSTRRRRTSADAGTGPRAAHPPPTRATASGATSMSANEAKYPGATSWPAPDPSTSTARRSRCRTWRASPSTTRSSAARGRLPGEDGRLHPLRHRADAARSCPRTRQPARRSSAGRWSDSRRARAPRRRQPTTPPPATTGTVPSVMGAPLTQALTHAVRRRVHADERRSTSRRPARCASSSQQTPGGNTQADPTHDDVQLSVAGDQTHVSRSSRRRRSARAAVVAERPPRSGASASSARRSPSAARPCRCSRRARGPEGAAPLGPAHGAVAAAQAAVHPRAGGPRAGPRRRHRRQPRPPRSACSASRRRSSRSAASRASTSGARTTTGPRSRRTRSPTSAAPPVRRRSRSGSTRRRSATYLDSLGWTDLNNRTARLEVRGVPIDAFGTDDPHREYDDLAALDARAARLRARKVRPALTLGVTHAPYRRILDEFVDQGADLLLAGHTHGGQVCVPGFGALVTNCDIPRAQVKGVSDVDARRHDRRARGVRRARHLDLGAGAVRLPAGGDPPDAHGPRRGRAASRSAGGRRVRYPCPARARAGTGI